MNNIHKYIINTFAVYCITLLHSNTVRAHVNRPQDERSIERKRLSSRYLEPLFGIRSILSFTSKHCNRFPSQEEFKKFILNGSHENIKCPRIIKTSINLRDDEKIAKDIHGLPEFLVRNQYKVYTDTNKIYVILKIDPKEWDGKNFKREEYESVISCTLGSEICALTPLELRSRSCRASKTFSKHCHFNGKKIIDY